VAMSYDLHANCYITKPVDFARLMEVTRAIEQFWLTVVRLPTNGK
jgi:two-component system, chemotaxis family, response regulator Rcp1